MTGCAPQMGIIKRVQMESMGGQRGPMMGGPPPPYGGGGGLP